MPEFKKTVVVRALSGRILVRRPGAADFDPLDRLTAIPLGSTIDAKQGRVALTAVTAQGRRPQRAVLSGGIATVTQRGRTLDIALSEALAACTSTRKGAAAARPKARRLRGEGKGRFRIRGRYSAATVPGTTWLVQDSCQGTLTRARQGLAAVRDTSRGRTILLRAGKKYLAKPRR
jgi:hypothetical protein